eukprot:gene11402-13926_t
MARIFLLLGASTLFGQEFAVGDQNKEVSTFHFMSGIATYLVAVAGLQQISRLLDRWKKLPPKQAAKDATLPSVGIRLSLLGRQALIPILAALTVFACRQAPEMRAGDEAGVVMQLPSGIGLFLGDPEEPGKIEREQLPADTEMIKMRYRTPALSPATRDAAQVTMVLSGAERRSIHRPEVCLDGQGWTLLDSTIISVEITPGKFLQ